jgi:RNA polymerase sigma-70 factor (ECF subfamily)
LDESRELLLRASHHDDDAARRLVEGLYPIVVKIVRSLQYDRSWEEDLVQEVFLKVFSRGGQYRGEAPLEHWVSRLAVSTCLDHRRARRRRPELRWIDLDARQAEFLAAELADPHGAAGCDDLAGREFVERLLGCLPARDALLLRLLDIEDRSVAEVHGMTGWSQTLIKVRAFRARRKLRKVLAALEQEYEHVERE